MRKEILIFLLLAAAVLFIYFYKKRKKEHRTAWSKRFSEENQIKAMEINDPTIGEIREKNNVWFKIQMYIISLCLLFVLIIPITIRLPDNNSGFLELVWYYKLFVLCRTNILPIVCLVMACVAYILFRKLEDWWRGTRNLSVQIIEVDGKNFEYLTFLTTYIIPLVCINLDELRYIVVLFALLTIIGMIFVRSDFYLGNPTLALMNYRLYRIRYQLNGKEHEKTVITKDRLNVNDFIESIPFDKNTWYVRRVL